MCSVSAPRGCIGIDNTHTPNFHSFIVVVTLDSYFIYLSMMGAQWLSGRVLDLRPKGRGFESHRSHCVVVLEQDTYILA